MQRIIKIAIREYVETIKTKAFIFGVLLAPLVIGVIVFFADRISREPGGSRPALQVDVLDLTHELESEINLAKDKYNEGHPNRLINLHFLASDQDPNLGQTRLRRRQSHLYVVVDPKMLDGTGQMTFYTHKPKPTDLDRQGSVEDILRQAVVVKRCEIADIPLAVLDTIREVNFRSVEIGETPGEQHEQNMADQLIQRMVPFFFMYLMFMGMMGTGQHMLSSVIEEKGSRVIEVLLSAVSPFQLMTGKIVGLCGIGLTVVAIWGSVAFGAACYKGFAIHLPLEMLIFFLGYFILGFMLFTALMAGIGSICNTIKECQSLMMPVMIVFIIPMIAWFRLVQDPNGLLSRVLSFIPPMTPMVMMLRLSAEPGISGMEIMATVFVLALGALLTVWLAARVFRTGILMYGKRPGLQEVFRWIGRS